MTYELAKQLKDTGFPQRGPKDCPHYPDRPVFASTWLDHVASCELGACSPTLSELIEACGDRFGALEKWHDESGNIYWSAVARDKTDNIITCEDHPNPEEAVSRLWLELNKKHGQP